MQVDDPLHDRQPEPGARCLRPRRSIEATADVRALLGRDAGPASRTVTRTSESATSMSTSTFVPGALYRMALSMTFLKRIERSPASPETNRCVIMRQLDVHPLRECGGAPNR